MKRSLGAALALLAMPLITVGVANAQTSTTPVDLGVSITIQDECTVSNVAAVAFATTGVLDTDVDAEGAVDVTCTTDTEYDIALSVGAGSGATVAERKMTGTGGTITYSLYADDEYETLWGDTVDTNTKAGTGNGSAQTHTIYGRIPAQATPASGAYSDTVAITVHY